MWLVQCGYWNVVSVMWWWWCDELPPSPLCMWRGPYLGSRVVPHLRGERGRVSCYSSGSLEGVSLPRQRPSRTLKTLSNSKPYIVCFLQLRDLRIWKISWMILVLIVFFHFSLRDFLNLVFRDSLEKGLNRFLNIRLRELQFVSHKFCSMCNFYKCN